MEKIKKEELKKEVEAMEEFACFLTERKFKSLKSNLLLNASIIRMFMDKLPNECVINRTSHGFIDLDIIYNNILKNKFKDCVLFGGNPSGLGAKAIYKNVIVLKRNCIQVYKVYWQDLESCRSVKALEQLVTQGKATHNEKIREWLLSE